MKLFISTLLLFSITALAESGRLENSPYHPALGRLIELQQLNGQHLSKLVKATYDRSIHPGYTTADIPLGVYLPANALITRSYIYTVTPQTHSLTGAGVQDNSTTFTTAVFCEDANNIKTATGFGTSAAGGLIEGQSTGAASAFVGSIADKCQINVRFASVDGGIVSAGKFNVFLNYVVTD